MMWYWGGGGLQWWGWLLMSLGMVVFWGLVIWAIWYFVTSLTRSSHLHQRPPEAKGILDERLARGEIGAEEYRRLRDLIGSDEVGADSGQVPVGTGGRQ
jgi:putative membrane protein